MGNTQVKTSRYRTESLEKLRTTIEEEVNVLSQDTVALLNQKDKLDIRLERFLALWELQNEASIACNPIRTAFSSTARQNCLMCKNRLAFETVKLFHEKSIDFSMSDHIEKLEKYKEKIKNIEIDE